MSSTIGSSANTSVRCNPVLKARWNDPDLADKFRSFFAETYRLQQAERRSAPPDKPSTASTDDDGPSLLASAALAVWDRDHEKWEKVPGSFETYNQLKAACYGLAKDPKTNPFHYAE